MRQTALTSFALPSLTTVTDITIQGNNSLTSLDLSTITSANAISLQQNTALTTVTLHNNLDCLTLDFNGSALTQVNVDLILSQVDNKGLIGGALNLFGGTSAAPSAAGLLSKASLELKGWTVFVNP